MRFRSIQAEAFLLEPEVRAHEAGAAAELAQQLSQLDEILKDPHVQFEPEGDGEASELRTKMHQLVQAAAAHPSIFKGHSMRKLWERRKRAPVTTHFTRQCLFCPPLFLQARRSKVRTTLLWMRTCANSKHDCSTDGNGKTEEIKQLASEAANEKNSQNQ